MGETGTSLSLDGAADIAMDVVGGPSAPLQDSTGLSDKHTSLVK